MPNTREKHPEKDLHTAITELILELKGNGTVSSLADKIGIPRNRLADFFDSYDQQNPKMLKRVRRKITRKKLPKNDEADTKMQWELEPLKRIADSLGMPLSELIRAAEDVQAGLPPWFHRRISEKTSPRTRAELSHIFLEAAGCRSYAMQDPLGVRGKRKSYSFCSTNTVSEKDTASLDFFADSLFDRSDSKAFVTAFEEGKVSTTEAYCTFKKSLDKILKKVQVGTDQLISMLNTNRSELIENINSASGVLQHSKRKRQ